MKLTKRSFALSATVVMIGTVGLAGCSSSAASSADADFSGLGLNTDVEAELQGYYDAAIESDATEVMIYAGHHDEFTAIYDGFEERFPGLTITTGTYVGAELQSTLEAERQTGKPLVSILSNPNGDRYAEQGFAAPFEVPTFEINEALEDRIDSSQLTDGEHLYYSPWALMFNISFNTDLVEESELPGAWTELGDPEWADRITFMNPSTPGGTMTVLTQLLAGGVLDETSLDAIGNNARIVASDQLALQGLSSAEFPVQPLAATTSIINAAENGAPVESYFLPENNVIATEKWMLTEGAPAPDAAKLFLSYLHTVDAQEQALLSGNFPINQDSSLDSPHGWAPLQDIDFLALSSQAELRAAMDEYAPLFQSVASE
ncbi:hypothetical protein K8P10_002554 [Leucobacter sp. Psy1]|nr:hypothetical protein K8P10_002554 [Leucobacter sp. Psy1]